MIRLLCLVNIMIYEDCLKMLDTENTGNMVAMSYAFRPLTKNGYVSKNKHGVVTVLKKGRELFPDLEPLFSNATHGKARQRVLQVSKVCMWMEMRGVPISGELLDTEEPYFIPSACWRNIGKGILATTRFVGMLVAYDKRYAVYDIGDGTMEWQVRAEASLFFYRYGSIETKADGMILIYAPRGTNNAKVWDTSNRAINVIINNLKGIFFDDDNFEHMACGIVADWGENGRTEVRICDFEDLKKYEIFR